MKNLVFSGLLSFLMTFLLSALISASAAMCFSQTFRLECDERIVIGFCCGAAFLAALSMLPRRRWILLAAEGLLLTTAALRQLPRLDAGFQAVMLRVTTQYAKDFPVKVIGSQEGDALWFVLPLGLLLAWITAWVCSRKGSVLPEALACLPVLVTCLMTVGIAPVLWLVLLTGGLVLLLVTQSARARDPQRGNCLAWKLLVPVALLIALPVLLSPPEDYVRADWISSLQTMAETRLGMEEYNGSVTVKMPSKWARQLKMVNLSRVGPQTQTGKTVLEYRADTDISYLRGVSLGVYEDNSWTAVKPSTFSTQNFQANPQMTGSGNQRLLQIRTVDQEPLLYTPYYLRDIPAEVTAIDDAYLENSQEVTEYTISYSGYGKQPSTAYNQYVEAVYTQLPEELVEPLEEYLREQKLSGRSAYEIANHVKNTAVYDLNTPRTPSGEDFVLHFLQESQQGYCVHFASAAVLLLRAEGIPARYVTGYAVSGKAGEWNTVTEDQSHAWVEYYLGDEGWRVLDPTPPDWRNGGERDTEQQPETPEEPEPPQTPEQEESAPEEMLEEPDTPDTPQTGAEQPSEAETPEQEEPAPTLTLPDILPLPGLLTGALSSGGAGAGTPQAVLLWQLPVGWLLVPVGVVLLLILRRTLILRLRHERCACGHPNRRMLACWRRLEVLAKATGSAVGPELVQLAQKARFSQHTVTDDELKQMERAVVQQVECLQKASGLKALWNRYIRVFY